jgi:hypothetical protein
MEIPYGSGLTAGRPKVTTVNSCAGEDGPRSECCQGESPRESAGRGASSAAYNRADTGLDGRARKGAHVGQVDL